MVHDFLAQIPGVTKEEYSRLQSIGAPTPLALESAMQASPEAFIRLVGPTRYREIISALDKMVPEHEREALAAVGGQHDYSLGLAMEQQSSSKIGGGELIEERDRIFNEIQRIKSRRNASPEAKQQLQDLESRLEEILKKQAA